MKVFSFSSFVAISEKKKLFTFHWWLLCSIILLNWKEIMWLKVSSFLACCLASVFRYLTLPSLCIRERKFFRGEAISPDSKDRLPLSFLSLRLIQTMNDPHLFQTHLTFPSIAPLFLGIWLIRYSLICLCLIFLETIILCWVNVSLMLRWLLFSRLPSRCRHTVGRVVRIENVKQISCLQCSLLFPLLHFNRSFEK